MYFIRRSLARAVGAKQYTPAIAQLQASRPARRRTFATSSSVLSDSRWTSFWLYGLTAVVAGSVLYLWRKGSQKAKKNATENIPEHHRAMAEYPRTSEASR